MIELRRTQGLPYKTDGKEPACNAGDLGLIPGSVRSPEEGNGNPLQQSCLENPMEKGALRAIVHGVTKIWTRLSDLAGTWPILASSTRYRSSYATNIARVQ